MARVMDDPKKFETWQNTSKGRHVVKRPDRRGEMSDELIGPMKTFHVTPEERRMNMELAYDSTVDPFSNGQFVPVRLIESADDLDEIKANPNLISEAEIGTLLDGKATPWRKFDERIAEIGNPVVLNRVLELAMESDATIRQVEAIKARIEAVEPTQYQEIVAAGPQDREVNIPVTRTDR